MPNDRLPQYPFYNPFTHDCVDHPNLVCPACAWAKEQGLIAPEPDEDPLLYRSARAVMHRAALNLAMVLFLVASALPSPAQVHHHDHIVTPVRTINGATDPDLIPDATAYRLVFTALAQNPSPLDIPLHFSPSERKTATAILKAHAQAFQTLIDRHNNSFLKNQPKLEADLNSLVQLTRSELLKHLSFKAYEDLTYYVRGEKAHMTIQVPEKKDTL